MQQWIKIVTLIVLTRGLLQTFPAIWFVAAVVPKRKIGFFCGRPFQNHRAATKAFIAYVCFIEEDPWATHSCSWAWPVNVPLCIISNASPAPWISVTLLRNWAWQTNAKFCKFIFQIPMPEVFSPTHLRKSWLWVMKKKKTKRRTGHSHHAPPTRTHITLALNGGIQQNGKQTGNRAENQECNQRR